MNAAASLKVSLGRQIGWSFRLLVEDGDGRTAMAHLAKLSPRSAAPTVQLDGVYAPNAAPPLDAMFVGLLPVDALPDPQASLATVVTTLVRDMDLYLHDIIDDQPLELDTAYARLCLAGALRAFENPTGLREKQDLIRESLCRQVGAELERLADADPKAHAAVCVQLAEASIPALVAIAAHARMQAVAAVHRGKNATPSALARPRSHL